MPDLTTAEGRQALRLELQAALESQERSLRAARYFPDVQNEEAMIREWRAGHAVTRELAALDLLDQQAHQIAAAENALAHYDRVFGDQRLPAHNLYLARWHAVREEKG